MLGVELASLRDRLLLPPREFLEDGLPLLESWLEGWNDAKRANEIEVST